MWQHWLTARYFFFFFFFFFLIEPAHVHVRLWNFPVSQKWNGSTKADERKLFTHTWETIFCSIKFNNISKFRGSISNPNGFRIVVLRYNIVARRCNYLVNGKIYTELHENSKFWRRHVHLPHPPHGGHMSYLMMKYLKELK